MDLIHLNRPANDPRLTDPRLRVCIKGKDQECKAKGYKPCVANGFVPARQRETRFGGVRGARGGLMPNVHIFACEARRRALWLVSVLVLTHVLAVSTCRHVL